METRALTQIYAPDAKEGDDPIAEGYELTRPCTAQVEDQDLEWTERVLVVRSYAYAEAMKRGLERRLANGHSQAESLDSTSWTGKTSDQGRASPDRKSQRDPEASRVEGLLSYTFERQVEQQTQVRRTRTWCGKNRPQASRGTRAVSDHRYRA